MQGLTQGNPNIGLYPTPSPGGQLNPVQSKCVVKLSPAQDWG